MKRLVDFFNPNNCRTKLLRACEHNAATTCDMISYMRANSTQIMCELKRDRRGAPRE